MSKGGGSRREEVRTTSTDREPPAFQKPYLEQIFSGAQALLDDRFYRRLYIEDQLYIVPFKYQGPTLDLAFQRSELVDDLVTIIARVKQFYAFKSEENSDPIDIPEIVFEVYIKDKLFANYGYEESPGYWEYDIIPRPYILTKTDQVTEPQPLIKYTKNR